MEIDAAREPAAEVVEFPCGYAEDAMRDLVVVVGKK